MRKALAVRISAFGPPVETVRCEEIELPDLGPDDVLVQMKAAPINPADINIIEGKYGQLPELPATIGNEGAGVVAEVGSSVTRVKPGDWVRPTGGGVWSSYLVLNEKNVLRLPQGIAPDQAAMMGVNPPTAYRMLHDFVHLKEGDWVVQNAANSAVGRSVIQLSKSLGIKTLNVVRRADLEPELKSLGATAVVTEDCDLRKEIKGITGGTLPRLALNAVGGDSALNIANALATGGTHVTYGAMSKLALKIPNALLIFKDIQFRGFWLTRWWKTATSNDVDTMYDTLARLSITGRLSIPVEKVYPVTEIADAVRHALQGERSGKILIQF